jgi:AmiR/NasT family two-component response regulator
MLARIVIAEDNWLTPTVLRAELEAHGYEVVGVARTGTEALELWRRLSPDVVLMDIRMPEIDGIEVTHRVMAEGPTCVVMVTGDSSLSHASEEAGAMGYLVKPFLPDEISAVVEMARERFARFQEVRAELPDACEALPAWSAVRNAIREIGDRDRVRDDEAFRRLRQRAADQGVTLRRAAEALTASEAKPLS